MRKREGKEEGGRCGGLEKEDWDGSFYLFKYRIISKSLSAINTPEQPQQVDF